MPSRQSFVKPPIQVFSVLKSKAYAQLYPKQLPEKLGFEQIRSLLNQYCHSPLGEAHVRKMPFFTRADLIEQRLRQTEQMMYLLLTDEVAFPKSGYLDLTQTLEYLAVPNAVLEPESMRDLRAFLETIQKVYRAFIAQAEQCSDLVTLLRETHFETQVLTEINRVIDPDGAIRKGVSPALEKIQRRVKQTEEERDYRFDNVMRHCREQGWLAEDLRETVRGGKRVLPLAAEHKRKIRGLVLDESATGKTVFVEPQATVEINNRLFELQQEERRELQRIMRELTARIAPYHETLRFYQEIAGIVDFIQAKARLSVELEARAPEVGTGRLLLKDARHPTLFLRQQAGESPVVPLKLELQPEQRILMISGPNAGGKSVVLKTVGLLQLMFQAGLPTPAAETSVFPVFERLFIDIGDDQSIENDLSTYSSHLAHMRHFLRHADENSLLLIDEFGSGTDPKVGGAIAEAILERFLERKAYGVITTHYSNLKIFADQTPGLSNGAMAFNKEDLRPLYQLQQGKPGSSYAFELAEQTGLPKDVMETARRKVGEDFRSYDELLAELERNKRLYEEERRKLAAQQKELDQLKQTYARLKSDLEQSRKAKLKEAEERYQGELQRLNREFERTVKEMRSRGGEAEARKAFKQQLDSARERVGEQMQARRKARQEENAPARPDAVGQYVRLKGGEEVGTIEALEGDKATVAFGQLRTRTRLAELELAQPSVKASGGKGRRPSFDHAAAQQQFSQTLDVRGQRKDEALQSLDTWLDQAVLTGNQKLRIIHGKGNGVLRQAIRDLLRKYRFVEEVRSEHPDHGGEGITLVELGNG
jgi:DNA mismatch repair protein MutS2